MNDLMDKTANFEVKFKRLTSSYIGFLQGNRILESLTELVSSASMRIS